MPRSRPLSITLTLAASVGACALLAAPLAANAAPSTGVGAAASGASQLFDRTATYPVYLNVPNGVDPAAATVSEISAISPDGGTVIYTDALGKRIGFIDVSDPSSPRGAGTVELGQIGHADDQPTSVATYGDFILVVIDETGGDFVHPQGRLEVLRASDHSVVRSIDLGGQPDSIAISADGAYAAIAMENQRDENATADGGVGKAGDIPQLPAGFVQVIDLGADPAQWAASPISLVKADGQPIDVIAAADGITAKGDPEPEYVTINSRNKLAVTLQENNGIVVIDLATKTVEKAFTAGTPTISGVDAKKDKKISLTDSITLPREPDSIGWVGDGYLATANEGDWVGGTRGWTVFDAATGAVVWDAGSSYEQLAVRHGLYNDDRAAKKGPEAEGLAVATYDGVTYAFVASERSNFVAVYDMTDPSSPEYVQTLFATNGPEGILPVPSRDLLVVSSETDAAPLVRAAVNLYRLGSSTPSQPSIVSDDVAGKPIGWQALGALSAHPTDPKTVYSASDVAVSPSTVYTIDVSKTPAHITTALPVTLNGAAQSLDIEGLFARPDGGFWLAIEGTTGAGNKLMRVDAAGAIQQTVDLPADVSAHIGKWGFEGVTAIGTGAKEQLYVAVQRPLWAQLPASGDPANTDATLDGAGVTRIGRYDVASGEWTWFGYQLESPSTAADWMGLSEITAVGDHTLAVIERDKLNGPDAKVKRVYTVQIPKTAAGDSLTVLPKTLAIDVLPELRATNGWTQEKLEGFTIAADGALYAVTDNDGLKDATGETVFLRLGAPTSATPTATLSASTVSPGQQLRIDAAGLPAAETVRVELHSTPAVLGTATTSLLGAATVTATIPTDAAAGAHAIVAVLEDGTQVQLASVTIAAASTAALASTGFEILGFGLAALAVLAPGLALTIIGARRRRAAVLVP
ncbi:MAG: esterase-like activity of phytase family protein [Leifsonia sp.]